MSYDNWKLASPYDGECMEDCEGCEHTDCDNWEEANTQKVLIKAIIPIDVSNDDIIKALDKLDVEVEEIEE